MMKQEAKIELQMRITKEEAVKDLAKLTKKYPKFINKGIHIISYSKEFIETDVVTSVKSKLEKRKGTMYSAYIHLYI